MKKQGLSSFKRRMRQSITYHSRHLDFLFSKCSSDYEKTIDNSFHLYSKKLFKLFLFFNSILTIIFICFCLILL